jgi:hypothetical protein
MHWLDHTQLPRIEGTVERFLLNPHGELDGLLLADGREVLFPPHLSSAVLAGVACGQAVTISGLALREAPVVVAAALRGDSAVSEIVDRGPGDGRHDRQERQTLSARGRIERLLHGPRGEVRGALLEDGTIVRLGKDKDAGAKKLAVGKTVAVKGDGVVLVYGRCIEAKHLEHAA